ncbi:hypothetical protein ACFP1Z_10150 [Streptomyces gamaensis]|uniref:Uncharacterized protein n=1 Tax=Streptomyces gamaensis TaxID=1763542 RepID=A0ABW0YWF5_9ACTN
MKPSRIRRRLAGAAAVTCLIGAGALATAPSAAAKANLLHIEKVSLQNSALQVKVTYSCDTGVNHQLVANATTVRPDVHGQAVAAGTIKAEKLSCDYNDHTVVLPLRTAVGSDFAKGEKVKVTVFYFDNDGFSYAHEEATAVL